MTAKEVVWTLKFIYELGVVSCIVDPILEYWDYNGAIAKAKGTMVSSKVQTTTKRMPFDLRNHWISSCNHRKSAHLSEYC